MSYQGNLLEDQLLYFHFSTRDSTGLPTTLAGTPVISVYIDDSAVQTTTGVTLSVDVDGVTGFHSVKIDTSAAAFYAVGGDFTAVITTGTVAGVSVIGESVATFSIENRFMRGTDSAATATTIGTPTSTDIATDIANVSAQVAGLGSGSGAIPFAPDGDNVLGAIKGVSFVGVQTSGTFATVKANDDVYHVLDDTTDEIDIVYSFQIGGDKLAVELDLRGFLNGNNDALNIQAYSFVSAGWDTLEVLSGQAGSSDILKAIPLLGEYTGTGSDLGAVLIRLHGASQSNPTLNINQLLVDAVSTLGALGFVGGAVWIDTVNGTAGTAAGIGTITIPSSNLADARTIADANSLKLFHLEPGSSDTLQQSFDGYEFLGFSYSLDLNGQSVDGTLFSRAMITGNDSGSNTAVTHFHDCVMATSSLGRHMFLQCRLTGTITLTQATDYVWVSCYTGIAGDNAPGVDFEAAVEVKTLAVSHYNGGLEFKNLGAGGGTHTVSYNCPAGQYILNANCVGGQFTVRGNNSKTDNSGGAVTITEIARVDNPSINAEADTAISDAALATSAEIAALNDVAASDIVTAGAIVTNSGSVVLVGTTVTNSDMRGTDSAALASVCTETRLAELNAANLPADVDSILADTGTTGVVISAATADAIATALLELDWTGITGESARSMLNALRQVRNRVVISGSTITVYKEDGTTVAWTGTVTTSALAEAITEIAPA